MSSGGWIKLEKDLLTDPRVLRMACQFMGDGPPSRGVTVVLGALAQIWILADTHIGNDDVMPLGIDEINKFIGLKGFCEIVPHDWLQVIDADNVKLPNYHVHNGTQAKETALHRKRNDRYKKRRDATPSPHGDARPSLDQDQDLYLKEPPLSPGLDAPSWRRWRDYRAAIKKPIKGPSVDAAMRKLAAFGPAQAATVEHAIANSNQGLYPIPQVRTNGAAPPALGARPAAIREGAAWAEVLAAARAEDFRNPADLETPDQYADALRRYRNRAPKIDTSAITGKLRGLI